jgi:8-oxo-dGTP pyrophosphatase MutT (NUDIX family)
MMRRPGGADFAPGAWVFPGGSVHADDSGFADPVRGAAVRELFEEMGVLLARRADGRFARDLEARRLRHVLGDGSSFKAGLDRLGLAPALDRLTYFQRWITPLVVRRRFDARFYVTKLPAGQREHPQDGEVVDWRWVTAEEAIDELPLVPATRRVLETLAVEVHAPRMIRKLRRRRPGPAFLPRLYQRDGVVDIVVETVEPPDHLGV